MKTLKHTTAKASYYNTRAECYDEFNENNSRAINALLEKILKEHHVATVLDLTCGTGSQVFWLIEAGFEVVSSDISLNMLKIAKQKAKLKADTFFIYPYENNPRAIRVYNKASFTKVGQYQATQGAFIGHNSDLMVKKL
ncbi:class I SAM-dependent methyltransferase [Orientia tsutsugamushi]|uniref:Methyltransferase domain-containing protein n=2 Tax=Orientia tsutsugamushi TaxID=784 RepID=B3CRF3_ORITI|nr:methyltransferase domain-containing protein [Orientia tsutsugamushi]KJV57000.1 ubiE/COQ5 methyltransferase family protein [Orientia tsutsugamushi str. Kato PP]BAG39994.1 hypothetical protein OTT_0536 [Orientia tsutsugamushi str. Ikeda]SPR09872.1 Ubiquinone/menaquinone biosynthesis C-methyltransferase UbiE [Orientia tsutsugamushi]